MSLYSNSAAIVSLDIEGTSESHPQRVVWALALGGVGILLILVTLKTVKDAGLATESEADDMLWRVGLGILLVIVAAMLPAYTHIYLGKR